jgi:hypothetical protein
MESTFDYLRAHAAELGSRILETYLPLQSTKDSLDPRIAALLRKALPAQALAITGTAKYLRKAKAARIVAECGAGKTFMALGTIHVLTDGGPSTTLVMCPSHITHKWAREALLTVPRARAFLIEDMRNGGDPKKPHGICEVRLSKGRIIYEGKRFTLADLRRMGRKEWRKLYPGPVFFITGKDRAKLGYYWEHAYLKAKSGPNLGGVINPDSGLSILDSECQKLTSLDFVDKIKVSERMDSPHGGTTRFSALWQADRSRIQRMAPIEYIGRYMRGWFDFAIADELHQLAGLSAGPNNGEERVNEHGRWYSEGSFLRITFTACAIFGRSPKEVHTCQLKNERSTGRGSNGSHTISRSRSTVCPLHKSAWQQHAGSFSI